MSPKIQNEILKELEKLQSEITAIFVSTYIPRPCGIATYTKDLTSAINILNPQKLTEIAVLDQPQDSYPYPWEAKFRLDRHNLQSYLLAADYINQSAAQIVHVQHEFGIFGGPSGEYVIPFLERITKPIVTTLHTVPQNPSLEMANIVSKIGRYSKAITVMSQACIDRLQKIYGLRKNKIVLIPHGVPDLPFSHSETEKKKLKLSQKNIISTINLLSPNKGLELIIQALPKIIAKNPNTLLIIAGVTHPEVLKREGETYRQELTKLVKSLKLKKYVRFDNRYITLDELSSHLRASDFYVTVYRDRDQTASGTLAYALAAGKFCISTPYIYAKELLADKRGTLVNFDSPDQIAQIVNYYLAHPRARLKIQENAYRYGRLMTWPNIALKHLNLYRLILKKKSPCRQQTL